MYAVEMRHTFRINKATHFLNYHTNITLLCESASSPLAVSGQAEAEEFVNPSSILTVTSSSNGNATRTSGMMK